MKGKELHPSVGMAKKLPNGYLTPRLMIRWLRSLPNNTIVETSTSNQTQMFPKVSTNVIPHKTRVFGRQRNLYQIFNTDELW